MKISDLNLLNKIRRHDISIKPEKTHYGMKLKLPENVSEGILVNSLSQIPAERYKLPEGQVISLDFAGRACSRRLILHMLNSIVWEKGIQIAAWLSTSEDTRKLFEAAGLSTNEPAQNVNLRDIHDPESESEDMHKDNSEKIQMPASFGGYVIKNPDLMSVARVFGDKAYISTYIIIGLFIILSIWIYNTKTGMRLRSCGEHPQAAASVGINVFRMRYLGTTISGALAGLGGYAYIATVANGTSEGTVGGMGFLALAIMIFGNWKPLGIAIGAVLFGLLKCIGPISSSFDFLKGLGLPMYFYNIIPYFVVLVVLAITAKRSGCPKAEGIPYDKGMR